MRVWVGCQKDMNFIVWCFEFQYSSDSLTCQRSHTIRFDYSKTYPDGSFVAVNPSDSQPSGQVEHVLQNLFIELKVRQLPLPLQCAQIDLVRGQILGEPKGKENKRTC